MCEDGKELLKVRRLRLFVIRLGATRGLCDALAILYGRSPKRSYQFGSYVRACLDISIGIIQRLVKMQTANLALFATTSVPNGSSAEISHVIKGDGSPQVR
jgi:hypothetical protein